MGKKKLRAKKPTARPPPPDSTIVESDPKQATLAINSSDPEINSEGLRALSAFQSGDSKKALEMIKESISSHQDSPHLHCLEVFMHHSLAEKAGKGTDTQLEHLTNAACSAELAVELFPNLVEFSFLHAALLCKLAVINDKEWEKVIEVCICTLKIENPDDMLMGSNLVDVFVVDLWTQKHHKLTAMKAEGEAKGDNMIKEDAMGLATREKQIAAIIRDLEQQMTYYNNKKSYEDDKKLVKYDRFWRSTLTPEAKRDFLKVNIKEVERHVKSLKNVVEILSEALCFAKEHKTWKLSECFICLEKFCNHQSYRNHLRRSHWKDREIIVQTVQSIKKADAASEWIEMIMNGVWKPVNTDKAIECIGNKMKSDKGLDMHKAYVKGRDGVESDQRRDSLDRRAKILQKIQFTFLLLLLKGEDMGRQVVYWTIRYAICKFESITPSSQFKCDSQKINVICFLGASQMKELLVFVNDLILVHNCGLDQSSRMDIFIDNRYLGLDNKERLVFNGDFSCLLLDERLLWGELNGANVADESAVLPDGNEVVSWLHLCPNIGAYSRLWKRLRDSRRGKAKDIFGIILEECSHLAPAQSRISELSSKMKAVEGNASDKHLQSPKKEAEQDDNPNPKVDENAYESIAMGEKLLREHLEKQMHLELRTGFTTAAAGAPVQTEAAGAPVQAEAADVPIQTENVDAPVQTENAGVPVQTEAPGVPLQTEAADVPVETEAADSPIQTEAAGAPIQNEAAGVPVETEAADVPVQAEAAGAPIQTEAAGVPVQTEAADVPVRSIYPNLKEDENADDGWVELAREIEEYQRQFRKEVAKSFGFSYFSGNFD
ncbi:USP domain-containing protein [Citrus sinensis]|uniref:USP domain-containing protein n=1 Tax=Citrus sinensis TaxID=2711 RepID=A0ACB8I691_CITSI|nr:USP domain-containing protein [Citrus sinensis]